MSDPRYAPYGVDDDPFLTRPAGPGQSRASGYAAHQPHIGGRGYGADDSYRGPQVFAPSSGHDAYDQRAWADYGRADGPHYGQFDPASYDPAGYETAAYDPPLPRAVAQQGNFRPRPEYDRPEYDRPEYDRPEYDRPEYDRPAAASAQPAARAQVPQAPPYSSFAAPPRSAARAQAYAQPSHAQPSHAQPSPAQPTYAHPAYQPAKYTPHESPQYSRAYAQKAPDHAPMPQGYDPVGTGVFGPSAAQITQWAGALCTVIALIGAGYWGYALAVRDANGIPVVRAAAGPLRVASESPGGEVSAHQGLAVNAIPAAGSAPSMPEQIILAPQVTTLLPDDLAADMAGAALVESGSFASPAGSDAALAGASDQILYAPQTGGGINADLTALPNALPEDMPFSDAEAVERALEMALAESDDFLSLEAEPVAAALAPASMSNTDPVAPSTAELDPAAIVLGTPMAQLGAFDTPEIARAEWANLQTRFTELMAGKALVVEPAKSGGRDFFRLRAHGFGSSDDSRRFCAAILAENGSCFPVDQR